MRRRAFVLLAGGAALSTALAGSADAEALPALSQRLVRSQPPVPPPALRFETAAGKTQTLADYRGKGIVLNVWATWCLPCKAEMPVLDRLAAAVSKDEIAVLPVSIDAGGLNKVRQFYAANHFAHLPIRLDPKGDIVAALKAPGIPTTVILDRRGLIEGRVEGGVQWDAPASIALLRQLVGPAT